MTGEGQEGRIATPTPTKGRSKVVEMDAAIRVVVVRLHSSWALSGSYSSSVHADRSVRAAPMFGGLLATDLSDDARVRAACALGLVIAGLVALVLLTGAGTGIASCAVDLGESAIAYVVGCLATGALAGSAMTLSVLATSSLVRRSRMWSGIGVGLAVALVGSVAAYELYYDAVRCLA